MRMAEMIARVTAKVPETDAELQLANSGDILPASHEHTAIERPLTISLAPG